MSAPKPTEEEKEHESKARIALLHKYLERKHQIQITGMERLDRGVYRVDKDDGGAWVAHVFSAKRPLERVQGDADVLHFLEEKGFPAERCIAKDPVSSAGEWSVLLTEFVVGAKFEVDEAIVRAMGEMLGVLHSLPQGSGRVAREAGALHHFSRQEGRLRNELDAARSWLDSVEALCPAESRPVLSSLREQLASADDCAGLPETLIHPDPVPKNFILTPEKELVLIDWTGAGRGPRLASLAILLFAGVLSRDGYSSERVDAVVAGYRSRVRLDREELARLGPAMRTLPVVFACWRFRHAIKSGQAPNGTEWWSPDDRLVEAISARARKGLG